MVARALEGDFSGARKMLDEMMLKYGMSGEEVILQVFREVTRMSLPDKDKVALVDKIGEYDFRMVEGANERIQLEALLAQIMLHGKKKD
jgi:replication factor C small subunit